MIDANLEQRMIDGLREEWAVLWGIPPDKGRLDNNKAIRMELNAAGVVINELIPKARRQIVQVLIPGENARYYIITMDKHPFFEGSDHANVCIKRADPEELKEGIKYALSELIEREKFPGSKI